ncbi:MAG: arsenate reductase ArsC [Aerococcus sp.]|nr:arsenate reductase ArsC [Aerococcus sp.]
MISTNSKPKVAFVCVHNSCRSQIAEALAKKIAGDTFEIYSAGTELKDRINPDAVRLMKEIYNIDMEKTQQPKLLNDIPTVDISITMGCDVYCPVIENQYTEDWNLDDPTAESDDKFKAVIVEIEQDVRDLKAKYLAYREEQNK